MNKLNYPFTAIVGQDELLMGIILNIINPKLGGLLIKGVKGAGKSTAVNSITDIIPEIKVLKGCKFNCDPEKPEQWCKKCKDKYSETDKDVIIKEVRRISVPLGITEDNLLGNIDVELLLKEGTRKFIPGIITKAHRQILYIDEVNLLPDHIIDDILDVAATHWNEVEREGFSLSHPSEFLLLGTMNPEEGELRPQILDRFPLSVIVNSVSNEKLRTEIIKRNLQFESNKTEFRNKFQKETRELRSLIKLARTQLNNVKIKTKYYKIVSKLCSENNIDGQRADIGIIKTALTHAAFELKNQVEFRHIKQASKFVLQHRTRAGGLSKPLTETEINDFFKSINENEFTQINFSNTINKKNSLFCDSHLFQQKKNNSDLECLHRLARSSRS